MAIPFAGFKTYVSGLSLSIVSETSGLSAQNVNGTINVPAGAVSGDLLVAFNSSSWSVGANTVSSSGQVWTVQSDSGSNAGSGRVVISTSPVTTTLGAHAVTFLTTGDRTAMTVIVIRNANTTSFGSTFISGNTTVNSSALTIAGFGATSQMFSAVMQWDQNTLHTPDANTTEVVDQPDTTLNVGYATLKGTNIGQGTIGGTWASWVSGNHCTMAAIEIKLA
jgi:hypothetical protein